jgi:S-formylglutathione hydrolase FrmB
LLPAEYEASARRYPVLYLLHGLTGGENDWLTRTNLSLYAAQYHLIIVMPGVGDSWYANSVSDPRARYEEAIVRDLIKHIDALYRTLASGYGRAVAGLSMGGLGALKFALRYPELFAFAASFSGAFDVPRLSGLDGASDRLSQTARSVYGERDSQTRRDDDLFLLLERIKPERTRLPYLYVSVGTNDALSSVMPSNPRLAEALRAHKIQYEYHERPGSHDWRFWDAEIGSALKRMSDFIPQMNKEQR